MVKIGNPPVGTMGFRRNLDELDQGLRTLSNLVIDGIPRATAAFLHGDEPLARAMLADHEGAKAFAEQMEEAASVDIARRSPVGSDLRFLVTVLRVTPALGRCVELVDHIANRHWVGPVLPADAVRAFGDMAGAATTMWQGATRAWCEADPTAAGRLDEFDDSLDRAIRDLPARLRHPGLTPLAAMQAAVVGRFYERLGDHAVDFAKRTRWYATGR